MPAEAPGRITAAGADPLAGLHDVALPTPPPWLPPHGPGWWLLAALLLGVLAWAGWRLWLRHRRNRYRREALSQLERLAAQPLTPQALAELSGLLKRTALVAYPRELVASLSGSAWRQFLCASGAPDFADAACAVLFDAPWRPPCNLDGVRRERLLAAARQWILAHRGTAGP